MKPRIGGTVYIRKDLKNGECGSNSVVSEMLEFKGKYAKIISQDGNDYKIDLDTGRWGWTLEMFGEVDKVTNWRKRI